MTKHQTLDELADIREEATSLQQLVREMVKGQEKSAKFHVKCHMCHWDLNAFNNLTQICYCTSAISFCHQTDEIDIRQWMIYKSPTARDDNHFMQYS